MDRMTIIQEIQPIFADLLDRPDLELTPESNASNVEGWDSLVHINLVVSIEKRFKVKFGLAELQRLKNLGQMADLILQKKA